MVLSAAITKTTAAWAVGTNQGGLDTGSIANSTWYHFYLIRRPDTGVVDVAFSTSASAPTLPTGYTQYRRIGAMKTNGSAQWTSFTQDGDYFRLAASVLDVNTTNPGTAAVTATLASVPTGVNVKALFNFDLLVGATGSTVYVSDLAVTDEAPSSTAAPLVTLANGVANNAIAGHLEIRTNTSAQIRYRLSYSDASVIVRIATLGWTDMRGRDA